MKNSFNCLLGVVLSGVVAFGGNAAEPMFPTDNGLALHSWGVDDGIPFPVVEFSKTETPDLFVVYDAEGMAVSGRSGLLLHAGDTWYKHWEYGTTLMPGIFVDYYTGDGNQQDVFFEGTGTFYTLCAVWNGYGYRTSVFEGRPACYVSVNGEETAMAYNEVSGLYELDNIVLDAESSVSIRLKAKYVAFDEMKTETEGNLFSYAVSLPVEITQENYQVTVPVVPNIDGTAALLVTNAAEYSLAFNPVTKELTVCDIQLASVGEVEAVKAVYASDGVIGVNGGKTFDVYTVDGAKLFGNSRGEVRVAPGVYVVVVDGEATKVLVK